MGNRRKAAARSPEVRENQLIALAVDLAEKKLRDGTASSQIITTLLNLATTKHRLELERMKSDISLKEAKTESLRESDEIRELCENAIEAMKSYRGSSDEGEWDDEPID